MHGETVKLPSISTGYWDSLDYPWKLLHFQDGICCIDSVS